MVKIVAGVVVGALVGWGSNHLCMLTGGACPLMKYKLIAILIWALIGGLAGAMIAK